MKTLRLSFLFFVCLISFELQAQVRKNYFDISAGPSFSMGQISAASNSGGYAGNGYHISFNYARISESGWGWALNMGMGNQRLKTDQLSSWLAQNGNRATFSDSSTWLAGTFTAGVAYTKRCGRFFSDSRLMAGIFGGEAPYVKVDDPDKLTDDQWKFQNQQQECIGSVTFMAMTRVGYQVCEKLYFSVGADIFVARPSFIIREPGNNSENPEPARNYDYSITTCISRLHFGVGVNW